MSCFKIGDLVAKKHPKNGSMLQVGIIIEDNPYDFLIKWTWYNKFFFMEKEEEIFEELNKTFLLGIKRVRREAIDKDLLVLNPTYFDEKEIYKRH